MAKRELNIPIDKHLYNSTEEDLIFNSPATIPDKGLQDILNLKKIIGSSCSYYDIAPTEKQLIRYGEELTLAHFKNDKNQNNQLFLESIDISEKLGKPTGLNTSGQS
jgi:hypothetical protein